MKRLWHLSNTLYGTLKGYDAESLYFQAKVFQKVAVTCLTYQGTGKTYASAFAMRELRFKRVLFLVHRGQLARQTKKSYEKVFSGGADTADI